MELPVWKKYSGTKKQKDEISAAEHGYVIMDSDGNVSDVSKGLKAFGGHLEELAAYYHICTPLPHARLRTIQALAGVPIYYQHADGSTGLCDQDNMVWHPNSKYQFTPFNHPVVLVRDYLYWDMGQVTIGIHRKNTFKEEKALEQEKTFISWAGDYREVPIDPYPVFKAVNNRHLSY